MRRKARQHKRPKSVSRAEFDALRRAVQQQQAVATVLESLRHECATNLRRCAELQFQLDRLAQLLPTSLVTERGFLQAPPGETPQAPLRTREFEASRRRGGCEDRSPQGEPLTDTR
jgi:hypothetical protein